MFNKMSNLGKSLIGGLRKVKVNNPSVPELLPLYSTGDKPIVYATEAVLFYQECAPVHTAIEKIALEISSIPPRVFDPENNKYIDDHPIFKILNNPDGDLTYKEFMHSIIVWYLITGNVYIRTIGMIDNPPKEMRIVPSQGVSIIADYNGYPRNYITRILSLIDNFDRFESNINGRMHYRYLSGDLKELYHIKTFNPMISSNMVYGLSPLNAVFYEIRQYIDSAIYNLSMLQRGSKIGGIFKIGSILTPEQRQRLEEQINRAMTGPSNSGRNIIMDVNSEFTDLFKNARDMDYIKMRDQVTRSIYNALKIPLPLISEEHMTLSNMETSKLLLYENAVLPIAKRIYEELTNFLMPRYGEQSKKFILTFNEKDIPALEIKKNEQLNLMRESGVFTLNELRTHYGIEPIDGGNSVFGQATLVPIATDNTGRFDVENLDEDQKHNELEREAEQIEQESDESKKIKKATRNEFIETMKLQINKDGTRRFTDEEIEALANKHFA